MISREKIDLTYLQFRVHDKRSQSRRIGSFACLTIFRLDLLLVEEVDCLEVFCDHLARLLVFLLDNDEGLNGFFALADDTAVLPPRREGKAVLLRIVPLSLFGSPALRDLPAD